MIRIVHASSSENGDSGWNGKAVAGDQTGREVCIRDFYSKPWNVMLRYPNKLTSNNASVIAGKLANSNLVGYDQSQRNTLYQKLMKYNFDVDKYIASGEKSETDCSAFVYACFACVLPEIRSVNNAPTTSEMRSYYTRRGFLVYNDTKHLTDTNNMLTGDILLKEGSHTVMCYDPAKDTINPAVDNALYVIARDVIAGNWGNGLARQNNIYNAIQNRVNELLK